ncbi:MAG: T9SS type A sorting domain-containing protein [Bacteroidales bacterium]|nr:T9SS type A sorting domain-containing protein [Bacteroidales bacterium]
MRSSIIFLLTFVAYQSVAQLTESLQNNIECKNQQYKLDSMVYSLYSMGSYKPVEKDEYLSFLPGNYAYWLEKISYVYENSTWKRREFHRQSYTNNNNNIKVHTILIKPWNQVQNNWDDTLYFIRYTGKYNKQLAIDVYDKYISKGYDYTNYVYTDGIRSNVILLNDSCPSIEENFLLNTTTMLFENHKKTIIKYNMQNLIDSILVYSFDANTNMYKYSTLTNYVYNGSNVIYEVHKLWNGFMWENSFRKTFTYNTNNLVTTQLEELWDNNVQSWVNYQKYEMSYAANNLIQTYISYTWDNNTNTWQAYNKIENEYNNNDMLVSTTTHSLNQNNLLVPVYKETWLYDQSNLLLRHATFNWDTITNDFIHDTRSDYIYSNNRLDSISTYKYYHQTSIWKLQHRKIYEYLSNTNLLTKEEEFQFVGGILFPWFKKEYYYSMITSANDIVYDDIDVVKVFPNPVSNLLTIKMLGSEIINDVKIYDNKGQVLLSKNVGSNVVSLDISDFSEGSYILKVACNDKVFYKKLLKLK